MFNKLDVKFDKMVADPLLRRIRIISLSKGRSLIGVGAMLLSVCALIELWSGKAPSGLVFAAALNWSICLKLESDLRLLRAIDWLEKDRFDKSTA